MGFPFGVVTHMRNAQKESKKWVLKMVINIFHNTFIKYPEEFAF